MAKLCYAVSNSKQLDEVTAEALVASLKAAMPELAVTQVNRIHLSFEGPSRTPVLVIFGEHQEDLAVLAAKTDEELTVIKDAGLTALKVDAKVVEPIEDGGEIVKP